MRARVRVEGVVTRCNVFARELRGDYEGKAPRRIVRACVRVCVCVFVICVCMRVLEHPSRTASWRTQITHIDVFAENHGAVNPLLCQVGGWVGGVLRCGADRSCAGVQCRWVLRWGIRTRGRCSTSCCLPGLCCRASPVKTHFVPNVPTTQRWFARCCSAPKSRTGSFRCVP